MLNSVYMVILLVNFFEQYLQKFF